jgi:RimJ/RimL family protein N-acetyltransferase
MTPSLATARLILRRPRAADAPSLYYWLSDFAVSGCLARVPYPYSLSDAARWIAALPKTPSPGQTSYALEHGGEVIGGLSFRLRGDVPQLGYWLGRPFWGRGLMSEAVTAALEWYVEATGGERIACGAFAFNVASLAIQQKMGFVVTGRSTSLCLARGREIEHIDTELTADAWRKARK